MPGGHSSTTRCQGVLVVWAKCERRWGMAGGRCGYGFLDVVVIEGPAPAAEIAYIRSTPTNSTTIHTSHAPTAVSAELRRHGAMRIATPVPCTLL